MAVCHNCKAQVGDSEATCPKCGKTIPANVLENIETQTSSWQKFIIAVVIVLLVAIAFTYYSAQSREDDATQQIFSQQIGSIVQQVAWQTGLGHSFGLPAYQITADPKDAYVQLTFPTGPLTQAQAAMFGRAVCALLAQSYVNKGYIPRSVEVLVGGNQPGGIGYYGRAIYNGNTGASYDGNVLSSPQTIGWAPAAR